MDTPINRLFGTVLFCSHGDVVGVAILFRYSRQWVLVRLYRNEDFQIILAAHGTAVVLLGGL